MFLGGNQRILLSKSVRSVAASKRSIGTTGSTLSKSFRTPQARFNHFLSRSSVGHVVSTRARAVLSPRLNHAVDSSSSTMAQFSAAASGNFPTVEPGKTKLGFIGMGVMGRSMAEHLVKGGYEMSVFNRTQSKCKPLEDIGATICETPRQVAERSDVVFSIVGFPQDVRHVILDDEVGVLAGLKEGGTVVDMTTSKPSLAEEIFNAAQAKGCTSLDAPVSGGDVGAREAKLAIMVGGENEHFERIKPLFELMGKNIRLMGPSAAGQHTKMINQTLIATKMIGVVEGLLYAYKAGIDMDEAIAAVETGAAGSFSISTYGPRISKRNFDPGFVVEHFIKDMGIALEEAERMELSLPGLALAHQLYMALKAQGHGKKGTHALMLAMETLNGIDIDGQASSGRSK